MSGRNSALSISDYSGHTHITDAVPAAGFAAIEKCTRVLSAQRRVRRSLVCRAKQNSCLHYIGAKEPEPQISFAVRVVRVPLYGELLGTENPENSARTSNRAAM